MNEVEVFANPRSAYLHIPFCHRRCFYCDFAVVPLGDKANGEIGPGSASIKSYLKLLHREISIAPKAKPLSTIYIGGGTPSLLSVSQLGALLNHLEKHFGFQDGCELSIEIDPASFNYEDLLGYLDLGINRISLGVQSFEDHFLELMGRRHRRSHLIDACNWLTDAYRKKKLSSWSLDLIKNLPGQDLVHWESQLMQAVETSVPHLSIYDLSIEPGTVFALRKNRGEFALVTDSLSEELSIKTSKILSNAGFARYEISNYALPGHASRHNRVYWDSAGWWGFGQGATSCPWGHRLTRPRTREGYTNWLESQEKNGLDPSLQSFNAKPIDFDDQLMVGLRKREGVDLLLLAIRWGWDRKRGEVYLNSLLKKWQYWLDKGYLQRRGWRVFLSNPEGMEISNQVLVEMFLWWDSLPRDAVLPPNSEEL